MDLTEANTPIGHEQQPPVDLPSGDSGRSSPVSTAARQLRWKPGLSILIVAALIEVAAWTALAPDRTWQAASVWATAGVTAIALVLWWSIWSGLPWRRRLMGFAVVAAAIGAGMGIFRFVGFTGEMFPILAFRWQETARQRAEKYWNQMVAPPALSTSRKAAAPEDELLDDWSGFRGDARDGVVRGLLLPEKALEIWAANSPQPIWKHPVGLGWSSFSAWGGHIYTQEQRSNQEAVVCYELETGRQAWMHSYPARREFDPGGKGPRATPTVTADRVYAQGAGGILSCLNRKSGKVLWSRNVLEENGAKNIEYGQAASPLVYDSLVVVNPGGAGGKGVVAYDRRSGAEIWSAGNDAAGYASLQLATLQGRRAILVFDSVGLGGHDAVTGAEMWPKFEWSNGPKINVAQPIVLDETRVFIGSGYGKGSALLEISNTGSRWSAEPLWTTRDLKLKFNDAVLQDGFVYGLDEGILVCLDLATGKRRWKQGRYGFGQLLLVDKVLVIQSESGDVVLVAATPEGHRELGRFHALDGVSWNCPAICSRKLLLRNGAEAACFELPGTADASVPSVSK